MNKKNVEFIEFNDENYVSINVFLSGENLEKLREVWLHEVEACQTPLISEGLDGLHVHIPWIRKKGEEPDE